MRNAAPDNRSRVHSELLQSFRPALTLYDKRMRSELSCHPSGAASKTSISRATTRRWKLIRLLSVLVMILPGGLAFCAEGQPDQKSATVAVVDGGAGPCAVNFTVIDPDGKPVYAAQIDVHVAYGFMGLHKLDLTVYTNAEGKARFAGLPAKVQKPPLVFHASKEKDTGVAAYNPVTECQAKHDIVLRKP